LIPLSLALTDKKSKTDEYSLEYAHKIFAALPENSMLFTTYTGGNTLLLMQGLSLLRPDIKLFDYGIYSLKERAALAESYRLDEELFPNRVQKNFRNKIVPYIKKEIQQRPVFFSRDEPFLVNLFFRKKVAEGIQQIFLKPEPQTVSVLPAEAQRTSLTVNQELAFLGFHIPSKALVEGELFTIHLFWKPVRSVITQRIGLLYFFKKGDLSPNSENHFLAEFTVGSDLLPPNQWKTGEVIKESFQFSVKPNLRKGSYRIFLSLFEQGYFENTPFKKIKPRLYPMGEVYIQENPSLDHYWD
jgi:hypothetical protein